MRHEHDFYLILNLFSVFFLQKEKDLELAARIGQVGVRHIYVEIVV